MKSEPNYASTEKPKTSHAIHWVIIATVVMLGWEWGIEYFGIDAFTSALIGLFLIGLCAAGGILYLPRSKNKKRILVIVAAFVIVGWFWFFSDLGIDLFIGLVITLLGVYTLGGILDIPSYKDILVIIPGVVILGWKWNREYFGIDAFTSALIGLSIIGLCAAGGILYLPRSKNKERILAIIVFSVIVGWSLLSEGLGIDTFTSVFITFSFLGLCAAGGIFYISRSRDKDKINETHPQLRSLLVFLLIIAFTMTILMLLWPVPQLDGVRLG